MFKFRWLAVWWLAFLAAGCTFSGARIPFTQDTPLRIATQLSVKETTQPSASPAPSLTPTLTIMLLSPAESKSGPPRGYVEPTPIPTPTMITMSRPADWKEIRLPPPKGSEQIMPKDVSAPTVRLAIPAQWQYTLMPGLYLVTPGPEASPPVLTLGPSLPFADQNETIPQNIQGFVQALERVYQRTHGIADARGRRLLVGGQEGVAIFSPGSEVCVDIFVPLAGRYDVAYKFTFMRSFCDTNQDALTETGQLILQSIKFEH